MATKTMTRSDRTSRATDSPRRSPRERASRTMHVRDPHLAAGEAPTTRIRNFFGVPPGRLALVEWARRVAPPRHRGPLLTNRRDTGTRPRIGHPMSNHRHLGRTPR